MTQEALKLALEALEANDQLINGNGTKGGLVYCMDGYYSDCFDVDPINKQTDAAIAVIKEALAQQEQEPVAWADLQKEAQQIVESQALWKKFIDGTPLANDIACWMTDFALQHTHPPQRTEPVAWELGVVNGVVTRRPVARPQRTEQEPVAYLCEPDANGLFGLPTPDKGCKDCFPVYRHSQRTWVDLTRTQIQDVYFKVLEEHRSGHQMEGQLAFGEALQARLKEKNT